MLAAKNHNQQEGADMRAKVWEIVAVRVGSPRASLRREPAVGSGHYRVCLSEAQALNRQIAQWTATRGKVQEIRYDVRLARREGR